MRHWKFKNLQEFAGDELLRVDIRLVPCGGLEVNQNCAICKEVMGGAEKARVLPCGNIFLKACIERVKEAGEPCPHCRKPIQSLETTADGDAGDWVPLVDEWFEVLNHINGKLQSGEKAVMVTFNAEKVACMVSLDLSACLRTPCSRVWRRSAAALSVR